MVTEIKKRGGEELTDKKDIEEKLKELKVNFVGRLAVVPLGCKKMGVCFMVVPGDEEELLGKILHKEFCEIPV